MYNDRSNLKSFLSWISEQKWNLSFQKSVSDLTNRAPRARKGKSLQAVRRGKGKNTYARQYSLPISVLKEEYRQLHQGLEALEAYAILAIPSEDLMRDGEAIRNTTFAGHKERIRQFYGWATGSNFRLAQERTATQLQKIMSSLAASPTDQALQSQKQELEKQLSKFREEQETFISPLETRKQEILADLSDLKLDRSKTSRELKKQLERALVQIEKCSLPVMLDTVLFNRFIHWGMVENHNGEGWAINFYSTAIFVGKFIESNSRQYEEKEISSILQKFHNACTNYSRSYKPNVREGKSEKWLTPDQQDVIVSYLKACTAEYDYRGAERSLTAILRSWQKYLAVLFEQHYPIRASELAKLERNKTLKWGINPETQQEGYYCEFSVEQTKKGKAKKWFLDPDIFNEPLKQWLEVWHPKANVEHDFLFFTLNQGFYGQPMKPDILAKMVKNCVFATSRDIKLTAQEELKRLVSEGQTEIEAKQSLSKEHLCFIDMEPRRTNIHYWRHINSTEIRKAGASLAQLKAFHEIIGNTVEMGNAVYTQLELEEETAAAVSWRRDLIEKTGLNDQTLDLYTHRCLSAALAIMSKNQLKKMRELGYPV